MAAGTSLGAVTQIKKSQETGQRAVESRGVCLNFPSFLCVTGHDFHSFEMLQECMLRALARIVLVPVVGQFWALRVPCFWSPRMAQLHGPHAGSVAAAAMARTYSCFGRELGAMWGGDWLWGAGGGTDLRQSWERTDSGCSQLGVCSWGPCTHGSITASGNSGTAAGP